MEETNVKNALFKKRRGFGGRAKKSRFSVLSVPLVFSLYLLFGFTQYGLSDRYISDLNKDTSSQTVKKKIPGMTLTALLNWEQFSEDLRDTVYTDKNLYLEVRVDRQMLYVHYRDGSVKEYPISTGIKGAHKSVDSRPGLFAIFMKEELHLSTQFDDAKMFYYMPYNMGIGFHGLAGTGYYAHLGVRPSSHGCVRMRTPDAKQLFKECEIGTLVLSHFGHTARVIAFAPEGFKNDKVYTKEDYMEMLAYNLNSVYEGKYLINSPRRFVIDPFVIPKNGFNIGSSEDIPELQQMPFVISYLDLKSDKLDSRYSISDVIDDSLDGDLAANIEMDKDAGVTHTGLNVDEEMINKLVFNKAGILPYFPPEDKTPSVRENLPESTPEGEEPPEEETN